MADYKFVAPAVGTAVYLKKGLKVPVYVDRLTIEAMSGTTRSGGELIGRFVNRISQNDTGQTVFVVTWQESGKTRTGWVKDNDVTWPGKAGDITKDNPNGSNPDPASIPGPDAKTSNPVSSTNIVLLAVLAGVVYYKFFSLQGR